MFEELTYWLTAVLCISKNNFVRTYNSVIKHRRQCGRCVKYSPKKCMANIFKFKQKGKKKFKFICTAPFTQISVAQWVLQVNDKLIRYYEDKQWNNGGHAEMELYVSNKYETTWIGKTRRQNDIISITHVKKSADYSTKLLITYRGQIYN